MKRIILFLGLCFVLNSVYSQQLSKESVDRGLWVRADANVRLVDGVPEVGRTRKAMEKAIKFIKDENKKNKNKPWVGVNLQLTWGQLYNGKNYNKGMADIVSALNQAAQDSLFVQLYIADKYQSDVEGCICNGSASNCDDTFYRGSTPNINGITLKALDHEDFTVFKKNNSATPTTPIVCNSGTTEHYEAYNIPSHNYRYARQQFVDRKGGIFLRKYFSSRWNEDVNREWLAFWKLLSENEKIRDHKALHSIITVESSNSLDNIKNEEGVLLANGQVDPNNVFNYPGGNGYVDYLANNSLELRRYFPDNILIINNTNWVFPNKKLDGNYYQEDVATKYLKQNSPNEETVGWCSQDIVLEGSVVYNSYKKRRVYDQMKRFPEKLRFGFVTRETLANSTIDSIQIPREVLNETNALGLSNLIFISDTIAKTGFIEIIKDAEPGDYPFMKEVDKEKAYFITNRATGARLGLSDNQNDLVTVSSTNTSNRAKWKIVYEDRTGLDSETFQLFNQENGTIIRYKANTGLVVKHNDPEIKWKNSFWKMVPSSANNFFLKNLESERNLRHHNNTLLQSSNNGTKAEWKLEETTVFIPINKRSEKITNPIIVNNKILIYPNPAANTIQIDKNIEGEILIYSISGQLIKSYPENQDNIDVSALNKGIYFIKINDSVGKFIKE